MDGSAGDDSVCRFGFDKKECIFMDPIFTPVVIEEALRVLLGAGATQAEINAAYTSILGRSAEPMLTS